MNRIKYFQIKKEAEAGQLPTCFLVHFIYQQVAVIPLATTRRVLLTLGFEMCGIRA